MVGDRLDQTVLSLFLDQLSGHAFAPTQVRGGSVTNPEDRDRPSDATGGISARQTPI